MNRLTRLFLTAVFLLTVGMVCYALNSNTECATATDSHACSHVCSHAGYNLECPQCNDGTKLSYSSKAYSKKVNCYLCKGKGYIPVRPGDKTGEKCTVKECVNGKIIEYSDGYVCKKCGYKCRELPE